jgi:heptaprenyl diphosphate synthase
MQSVDKGGVVKSVAHLGLLGSLAVILFMVETLVPRLLPSMRLGLGNAAVLLALLLYGWRAGLTVSLVKILLGGLLSGGLFGPAFVIGGGAGLASMTVMGGTHQWMRGRFSPIGLSVLGAVTHQSVQLALAYGIYIRSESLLALLPLFWVGGLLSGGVIGILVYWVVEKLRVNGWVARGPKTAFSYSDSQCQ